MTKADLLKRIRAKCLDCCCNSAHEVGLCVIPDCSLYPLRLGKDPERRRLSEKEIAQRMQNLRQPSSGEKLPPRREAK